MTIDVANITIDGSTNPPTVGLPVPGQPPPPIAADWNGRQYEADVQRVLRHIFITPVGETMVAQIAARPRQRLTIEPFPLGVTDGDATPQQWGQANPRGTALFNCGGALGGLPAAGLGTGTGSDSVLRFTPYNHLDPSQSDAVLPPLLSRRPGSWADEMLCHELVHSIRQMWGVQDCLMAPHGYDTFEEFCAIEVTNMFASQFWRDQQRLNARRPLRADHHGFRRRMSTEWVGNGYSPRVRHEMAFIERMRAQQGGFCGALQRLPREVVPYNPFRDPPNPRLTPVAVGWP